MECATTSMPTAPTALAQAVFYFPIPERPEYVKNTSTILMYREKFNQLHTAQRQLQQPLNNLEKWIPKNRENLRYKKQQTWRSLFMRTNGKGNNPKPPAYNRILFESQRRMNNTDFIPITICCQVDYYMIKSC